jgi:hypothetical protein
MRVQIYGKENQFNAARLVDLLGAYETFKEASQSARGSLDEGKGVPAVAVPGAAPAPASGPTQHGSFRPAPSAWPRVRPPFPPSLFPSTKTRASCAR